MRSLAIVALLAAPAFAGHGGSPALRFGATSPATSVGGLSVSVRGDRTTAQFTVSTSRKAQDAWVVFEVPANAHVTYLGITTGGEHRIAHATLAADATTTYENAVLGIEDPAVLEWVEGSTNQLRLRVFPLDRGKPARVELIMAAQADRSGDFVCDGTSLFIGAPTPPEPVAAPAAPPPKRGAFKIAEECLRNALAPSCM